MGKHLIVISLAPSVTSPEWPYPMLLYTWPAVMTDVPTIKVSFERGKFDQFDESRH